MNTELIESIFVDVSDGFINYGYDQAYYSYPCTFQTVTFPLRDTHYLNSIIDAQRKDNGYLPAFPEKDVEEYDFDCWYNFYIDLNGYNQHRIDTCITAIVVNSPQEDNESIYYIDLSEEEQEAIYQRMNVQLTELYDQSCEDFLAIAEQEMLKCLKWREKSAI